MLRIIVLLSTLALAMPAPRADGLDRLAGWMTGSFSSEEQAAEDESYFDIRLEMVPIWTDRADGRWLYVEQAAALSLDSPYRQRVYHLTVQDDGSFRSEVYAIPDPLRFAGAWKSDAPLADLSPDALELREGCAVILRAETEKRFVGSTVGTGCSSTLRGASYATSEVTVRPDSIESWDRGFAESGEQMWGAEKGPYLFKRK
jgi:hypothetical protein